MAPQMARIEYVVKARVMRVDDADGRRIRIMETVKPINVLPASVEEPPLSVVDRDGLYTMSKAKSLRKNMLSSKLGRVTAEAVQPTPAVLRSDGLYMTSQPTAHIRLTFDPSAPDALPPRISGVSGKITAHTFYSSGTIASFPNLGDWSQQLGTEKRGYYSTSASLPAIATPKARWTQHLTSVVRRDSGYSSEHSHSDSASGSGSSSHGRRTSSSKRRKSTSANSSPIYHTAELDIPVVLPANRKTFIPTFHSCIASRVYTLQLTVSLSVGSSSATATSLSLTIPLQLAVEADLQPQGGLALPSFDAAVAEAEADEHLRPRVLAVPDQHFMETSVLPGYLAVR